MVEAMELSKGSGCGVGSGADKAMELGEESGRGVGGSVWMRLLNSVKSLDVE